MSTTIPGLAPKVISDPSAVYSRGQKVITNTVARQTQEYYPISGRDGIKPGNTISFVVSSDMSWDPSSTVVYYTPSIHDSSGADVTATAGHEAYINNAADAFNGINTKYQYKDMQMNNKYMNVFSNQFISMTANDSWTEREGTVMTGYNHPALGKSGVASHTRANREFGVPLCLLHGLFRVWSYVPLVGGKVEIILTIAPELEFLSRREDVDDTFQLNNVRLQTDIMVMDGHYRNDIMTLMKGKGFQIPFVDYFITRVPADAGTKQQISIRRKFLNALSLFVLRNNVSDKVANDGVHTAYCQSFPIQDKGFKSFTVRSGTNYYTPSTGIKSLTEMYAATEKSVNRLCDLDGTGIIGWDTLNGTYVQSTNFTNMSNYGAALLGCSLEKTTEMDGTLMNNGLTTGVGGNTNEILIDIETNTPMVNGEDEFLVCIAHKRVITFGNDDVVVTD